VLERPILDAAASCAPGTSLFDALKGIRGPFPPKPWTASKSRDLTNFAAAVSSVQSQ
jgi:hypothetical protein